MSLTKTVAVLLVAVFANPLCCCLSAFTLEHTAPEKAIEAHGCCQSQQTETSEKHTTQDCQHQIQKDLKISHSADSTESLAKPLDLQIIFLAAEALFGPSVETDAANYAANPLSTPPDAPTPQAYCVYLL